MSTDLQIVFPQALVELTGVRVLQGFEPRTLDVLGVDFRAVDEVLINDQASPDVVILGQSRLLAQIPDGLQDAEISSVVVVSNQLTVSAKSLLRFRLGRTPSKVKGILRLTQYFLKVLFTTPGTDIFYPDLGGGALRAVSNSQENSSGIVNDMVISVNSTQRQILAVQARDSMLPRDERLLSARVLEATHNYALSSLNIAIEVTSQAGRTATANVTV